MIQSQTIFHVCDNSGAKKVKCIKVLGGFKRKFACVGDRVVGSIQYVKQHKKKKIKVKEGEVVHALVVRTRAKVFRKNFSRFSCQENSIVLVAEKTKPIATRILGPVSQELRSSKFLRIASLSSGFF
jgi:large subunit ribosomal protein L14